MKKLKYNLIAYFIILAISAGIFVLCGFSSFRIPRGVSVNGISVGGLKYADAAAKIRAATEDYLKDKTLVVAGDAASYSFTYPEIYYKDDVYDVLKTSRKGGRYTAKTVYYLNGLTAVADYIACRENIAMVEPYFVFSATGKPFTYYEGNDGRAVDIKKLREDIVSSLNGDFSKVCVAFTTVSRTKSLEEIKTATAKISSFTTYFDSDNKSRTSNIRLAASKLNGFVLESGKTLSFNDIVGARLEERGFLPAKIIENGEFTEGVGGGVCQVSTTLYNAALLGGLKITEYHPHSLAVGYVPPSRDAMVSGRTCDLKIENPFDTPVYIRAAINGGSVRFDIYGLGDGATYSLKSQVTGSIAAAEEFTDEPEKARSGKDGLLSEGYLIVTRNGIEKRVFLRKDKYLPIKKIILKEETKTPSADGGEDGDGNVPTDDNNI